MHIWKKETDLVALDRRRENTLMRTLGIRMTEIGDDFLRAEMPVNSNTRQRHGLLHGGAYIALAEALGSTAAILCTNEGMTCVGLEINANYLCTVRDGVVTGTARPLHIASTKHVWEIRVENAEGDLACIVRLTTAVIGRKSR